MKPPRTAAASLLFWSTTALATNGLLTPDKLEADIKIEG